VGENLNIKEWGLYPLVASMELLIGSGTRGIAGSQLPPCSNCLALKVVKIALLANAD